MDARDAAFDPFRGSFLEETMSGVLGGEDGELIIKCHYEVCDLCNGKGSHVNPSIDAHGISSEEFYEDPDFAENYFSGVYDVACYQCGGKRVVPIPNDDDPGKEDYNNYISDHYEYMAEIEAERRMGC
jgi:hypothetical protein